MDMKNEKEWKKAKRLCRLSVEDIRMARELGMSPRGLMKNIPSPTQRWKAPVKVWIRDLYEKKFGRKSQSPPASVPPAASRSNPLPEDFFASEFAEEFTEFAPPTADEVAEEDELMRRQRVFRLAADHVAKALAKFETVQKIAIFGSVASPLEKEVPRFRKFRRARQPIFHESKDLDLAVWLTDLTILNSLRKARTQALAALLQEHDIGVAHHQVEVFLFSAQTNAHLGRLCTFNECPKGKPECLVPNCGAEKLLRQVNGFVFQPDALAPAKTITLYEHGVFMPNCEEDDDSEIPF
jgi:hypothetical protein